MQGHLVIAGGNVRSKNIYEEFLKFVDGGKVAIVPTASSDTRGTLIKFTDMFEQLGIKGDKKVSIKLDPDGEPDGDWKKSGDDFESLDFLNNVKGIWFTGGDQIKIIRSFLKSDGIETKLLKKFKDILNSGGVIGGSSAGAAIMSEIMIGGGTSLGALSMPYCEDYVEYRNDPQLEEEGMLLITKGLGFFKFGIIDQHFDEESRLGRLLEALLDKKVNKGFGISEDTAMICDIKTGDITIAGSGRVTIIDTSNAVRTKIGSLSKISNAKVNYLTNKEIYSIYKNHFDGAENSYANIVMEMSPLAVKIENF